MCFDPNSLRPEIRMQLWNVLMSHRKLPVPEAGCWLWDARCDEEGYPRLSTRLLGGNRGYHAVRLCYSLYYLVKLSKDTKITHECGTRSCINPDHLRVASMREINEATNLAYPSQDTETMKRIFNRRAEGVAIRQIARECGVTPQVVRRHVNGKSVLGRAYLKLNR